MSTWVDIHAPNSVRLDRCPICERLIKLDDNIVLWRISDSPAHTACVRFLKLQARLREEIG